MSPAPDPCGAASSPSGSCTPLFDATWHSFTADADGEYVVSTSGSTFDTVLYALESCGGQELACNDDNDEQQSEVTVPLTAGQQIVLGVGSYGGRDESGQVTLSVTLQN